MSLVALLVVTALTYHTILVRPSSSFVDASMCGCEHRYATLMDMFYSTNGSLGWVQKDGWGENASRCEDTTWFGVTCLEKDVVEVKLAYNQLSGSLPPSWRSLSELLWVDLRGNRLTMGLPAAWSNLTKLHTLQLDSNLLSGPLPPSWSDLEQLETLELAGNNLEGSIPSSWSSMLSLKSLDLHYNRLEGTIPAEIGNMPLLQDLRLYENRITGELPSTWGGRTSKLSIIRLQNNFLSGTLPPTWVALDKLQLLYLGGNNLSGTLPESWSAFSRLKGLHLYENNFNGSLPKSWGNMTSLSDLRLYSNQLTGSLPSEWGNISTLKDVRVYSNQLSGTLPDSWSAIHGLKTIQVYQNKLTGSLPPSWGSLTNVEVAYMMDNTLSGTLPASWCNMSKLKDLRLARNLLSGTLPEVWSSLGNLEELRLEHNTAINGTLPVAWSALSQLRSVRCDVCRLSGPLPNDWGKNMRHLVSINLFNNKLSGELPVDWGNLASLESLELAYNDFSGTLPNSWGAAVSLKLLHLNNNRLVGNLPSTWATLARLDDLRLSNNELNGTLPYHWGILSQLRNIHLQYNKLAGTLPRSWSSMGGLERLYLYQNSLEGSLPDEWGALSSIRVIDVSSNRLEGTIPERWAKLADPLEHLYLNNNRLNGTLWSGLGQFRNLRSLRLHSNTLSGTLPPAWGLLGLLLELQLQDNDIEGELPDQWGKLFNVHVLSLHENGLWGTLPDRWGELPNVTDLDLSRNNLIGTLPQSWSALRTLQALDVAENSLSGTLPVEWIAMQDAEYLGLASNCLEGFFPNEYTTMPMLYAVDVCNTRVSGDNRKRLGNCSSIGWPERCLGTPTPTTTRSISLSESIHASSASLTTMTSSQQDISITRTMWNCSIFPGGTDALQLALSTVAVQNRMDRPTVLLIAATTASPVVTAAARPVEFALTVASGIGRLFVIGSETDNVVPQLMFNISVVSMLKAVTRWTVGAVDGNTPLGGSLNFTSGANNSEAWYLVTVRPPTSGGWLPSTVPLVQSSAIVLRIRFDCDAAPTMVVVLTVPLPGVAKELVGELVVAASRASQVAAVLAGGASSGSAVGRAMAIRSMVLCDADASVGGGVVDLSLIICGDDSSGAPAAARSAIVSNFIFVGVVASVLASLVLLWIRATVGALSLSSGAVTDALRVLALPSALLPVWIVTLPSTSAAFTLLLARLPSSACVATDALLGLLGILLASLPCFALWLLWASKARGTKPVWICKPRRSTTTQQHDDDVHRQAGDRLCHHYRVCRLLRHALQREWKWTIHNDDAICGSDTRSSASSRQQALLQHYSVILLEYRSLWYVALDSSTLLLAAVLGIASGLSPGSDTCRACTIVVTLMLALQVVVLLVTRPFTTLFGLVHAAASLIATTIGVAAQLAFNTIFETDPAGLWLLQVSAACDLAVVGMTVVRMCADVFGVYAAVRQRIMRIKDALRRQRGPQNDGNTDMLLVADTVSPQTRHDDEMDLFVVGGGFPDSDDDEELLGGQGCTKSLPVMGEHSSPPSPFQQVLPVVQTSGGKTLVEDASLKEVERQFWDDNGVALLRVDPLRASLDDSRLDRSWSAL